MDRDFATSADLLTTLRQHEAQVERLRAAYDAAMTVVARDAMTYWLAVAAFKLREASDRLAVHIAAELSMSESTVSRFERHLVMPRNLDRIVAGYARELDIKPIDIWSRALDLWREAEDATSHGVEGAPPLHPTLTPEDSQESPEQSDREPRKSDEQIGG